MWLKVEHHSMVVGLVLFLGLISPRWPSLGPSPPPLIFHGCHGLPLPSEQEYLTDTQIHIRRLPQRMHSAVAPWAWLELMGSYMAIWSIFPTSLCKQAAFGWGRRLMQDLDGSVF